MIYRFLLCRLNEQILHFDTKFRLREGRKMCYNADNFKLAVTEKSNRYTNPKESRVPG